jgi:hypothetical protein
MCVPFLDGTTRRVVKTLRERIIVRLSTLTANIRLAELGRCELYATEENCQVVGVERLLG